jgi:hypothetical protein
MANELEIPGGVKPTNNVPTDAWYGPYASLADARAAVPVGMRLYRTVGIIEAEGVTDYVWRLATGDADLLVKTADADPASETEYGTTTYGIQTEMEQAADEPVITDIPNTIGTHLRGLRYFINRVLATARVITAIWTAPTPAMRNNTQQLATTEYVQNEINKVVNLGDISGIVSINGATGRIFTANVVGNITLFSVTNITPGVYSFVFTMTANRTIVWAPSIFGFPYKNPYLLTDPVAAGQASATDIFTGFCFSAGTLHMVNTPNSILNTP